MKCGQGFFKAKQQAGISVLSITNSFPSLIQPWFVNQLVEIIHNSGENRILSIESSEQVYTDDIDKFQLLEQSASIPWISKQSLASVLQFLAAPSRWPALWRGLGAQRALGADYQPLLGNLINRLALSPFCSLDNFDVIHSHSELAAWRFLPIIAASNKPWVITFHGLPPKGVQPLSSEQRAVMAKHASVVLVNTEFAKQHYAAKGGDPAKVRILPQGLRLEDFPFEPLAVPQGDEAIQLLTVGRFHPDKGQSYALEAMQALVEQGINLRYTMIGNGPDRPRLEELATSLGLAERVSFKSGLSDSELRAAYRQAHIFILPSLRDRDGFHEETQGVVMQEAQASGALVIATRTGGIPECLVDGEAGFLIEDRSSQSLADKIRYLIENRQDWPHWQQAGRQHVESHYDIKQIGLELQAIYKQAMGG
ncbi:glycosyltransferase family 4 protein [Aliagarivorans taiwanensis]|uniref:glycosyltransferase family 4 protein n=1 Tax=Aliagarivorans taiwanensis TaxID=561966 RepID=UPI0004798654|nr:glycosyltransferase family 4 protein [Aliagarivorans taiwanensis]